MSSFGGFPDFSVPSPQSEKSQEELLKDIYSILLNHEGPMTQKQLESGLHGAGIVGMTSQKLAELLGILLRQAQITLSKDRETGVLQYVAQGKERATQFKGLGMEDMLVYQLIKEAHDKGIWIRNLKSRSGLQTVQMNKTLKALESRRLIKSVKTIANRSRKVYMLYELMPHRSLVGGPWVTDSEFDKPFFEQLQRLCERYVTQVGYCSSIQAHEFIRSSGVSTVDLGLEDVEILLSTLVYDGRLERFDDPRPGFIGGPPLYKMTRLPQNPFNLASAPCGICPVSDQCHEDGEISPATCVYLSEWLDPDFEEQSVEERMNNKKKSTKSSGAGHESATQYQSYLHDDDEDDDLL